jgi:hypothetical protein
VLRESEQTNDSFSIVRAQVNLWLLQGRVAHFMCDVGLQLTAGIEFDRFQLLLPFDTSEPPEDLFTRLQEPDTSTLVFGEKVAIHGDNRELTLQFTTRVPSEELDVRRIQSAQCERRAGTSRDFSVWTIRLFEALPAGQTAYYRFRFSAPSLGRIWTWKSTWPGVKNGAMIDFRVNDTRDLVGEVGQLGFERYLMPIPDLYLFVISPWGWQVRTVSPGLTYSRVLEGQAWIPYLGYRLGRQRKQRALVHYWRWPPNKTERIASELMTYRAFLDLSRDPSVLPWVNHLRWLAMMIGLAGGVAAVYAAVRNAAALVGLGAAVLGSALGVSLILWAAPRIPKVVVWARAIRKKFRARDLRRLRA